MSSAELRVLKRLLGGSATAKDFGGDISRSTLYRALRALVASGRVLKEDGAYRITPAGEALLREDSPCESEDRAPAALRSHLELLPTPEHRAFAGLALCARAARKFALRPSHHASLLVIGPPMKWKTFLATAICHMTGADPAAQVVAMNAEAGRSLLARRGARGERVSEREALAAPVIVLDEYPRSTKAVLRQIQVLISGALEIPFENEILKLHAVPVLTGNAIEGKATLEGRTRLDSAMLRRCVTLDLSEVSIPEAVIAEGEDRLEAMLRLGEVRLDPPRAPNYDSSDRLREGILACLKSPDQLRQIDLTMLAMLVAAATSFMSPGHAVAFVLTSYLRLVNTLGWLKNDWEDLIPRHAEGGRKNGLLAEGAGTSAPPGGRFDYGARLERLAGACARLGVHADEVVRRQQLLKPLAQLGIKPEGIAALVAGLEGVGADPLEVGPRLGRLLARDHSLGQAIRDGENRLDFLTKRNAEVEERVVAAVAHLRAVEIDPAEVDALGRVQAYLKRLRLGPSEFVELAEGIRRLGDVCDVDSQGAISLLMGLQQVLEVEAAQEGFSAQESRDLLADIGAAGVEGVRVRKSTEAKQEVLRAATANLKRVRRELSAEERFLSDLLAEEERLGRVLPRLRREHRELCDLASRAAFEHRRLSAEVRLGRELVRFLSGYGALPRHLGWAMQEASQWRGAIPTRHSARARESILSLLGKLEPRNQSQERRSPLASESGTLEN